MLGNLPNKRDRLPDYPRTLNTIIITLTYREVLLLYGLKRVSPCLFALPVK